MISMSSDCDPSRLLVGLKCAVFTHPLCFPRTNSSSLWIKTLQPFWWHKTCSSLTLFLIHNDALDLDLSSFLYSWSLCILKYLIYNKGLVLSTLECLIHEPKCMNGSLLMEWKINMLILMDSMWRRNKNEIGMVR